MNRWNEESGGGLSGCGRAGAQRLLLSLQTKLEPESKSFPFTQDQLGSINGFGVDQLMAIIFRCFDSVCTDNPNTHICMGTTAVQCWCLHSCVGWLVQIKSSLYVTTTSWICLIFTRKAQSSTLPVYSVVKRNWRVQSQTLLPLDLGQRCRGIIKKRNVCFCISQLAGKQTGAGGWLWLCLFHNNTVFQAKY